MISYKRSLSWSLLRQKETFNILDYLPVNDAWFFIASARSGIESCIELLGMKPGDAVLLPAFVAQGVIEPFRIKKINIVYYKSKADLKFDAADIRNKIENNKSIRSIVIIHYFGFPQNINEIKSF